MHGELLHELEGTAECDRLRIAEPSAEQTAEGDVDVGALQIRAAEVEGRRRYLSRRRKANERHLNPTGGARDGKRTYDHGREFGELAGDRRAGGQHVLPAGLKRDIELQGSRHAAGLEGRSLRKGGLNGTSRNPEGNRAAAGGELHRGVDHGDGRVGDDGQIKLPDDIEGIWGGERNAWDQLLGRSHGVR